MNKLTKWNPFRDRLGAKAILGAVAGLALLSGCATVDLARSSGLTPTEKMMWSTYALVTPKGMATCVIVNRRDPAAPDGVVPVVITSAHVLAAAPNGPYYLIVRETQRGQNPNLGILEFKSALPGDRAYFENPNADVAVLELKIPPELAGQVSLTSFIDERAIGRDADEARVGEDLSILGFPHVFPGTAGGFAVLRSGKMASYSTGTRADREKFLINASVYGGDSGAPVFASKRLGPLRLVGLIAERVGEKDQGIPLAIALNASVIRETLDMQREGARVLIGDETLAAKSKSRRGAGAFLAGPPRPFSGDFTARITRPTAP